MGKQQTLNNDVEFDVWYMTSGPAGCIKERIGIVSIKMDTCVLI